MKRKIFTPRPDWQVEHQNIGFDYFNLPLSMAQFTGLKGLRMSLPLNRLNNSKMRQMNCIRCVYQ